MQHSKEDEPDLSLVDPIEFRGFAQQSQLGQSGQIRAWE
jgi:hypothetical protein